MSAPLAARFIVIEGPEGAGKSTQVRRLAEALRKRGAEVVVTHEPGGTPAAEAIRRVFLSGEHEAITPLTELFLICAARAQHIAEVVRPALEAGRTVLCDRFSPSTMVYQGYAGGLPLETARVVDEAARQGLLPDLTIVVDVPAEVGLQRNRRDNAADRMEGKGLEFHRRVREGYLRYAAEAEEPCVVISGEADAEAVAREVLEAVVGEAPNPPASPSSEGGRT
ncbi:MAG: dTMP kinase [Armatimonadetes bacterium]|nr:dTMP kinase [Armatimonadota bacterium]